MATNIFESKDKMIISQFCQIGKDCLLLKCRHAVSEWWKVAIFALID